MYFVCMSIHKTTFGVGFEGDNSASDRILFFFALFIMSFHFQTYNVPTSFLPSLLSHLQWISDVHYPLPPLSYV